MSWERKLWEEEEKTQVLLDELGYSQEQRRLDELFHGDAAFEEEWATQRAHGNPHGWLLGSPYHRRLGGQVYLLYLCVIGICIVLGLIGFGLKAWVNWRGGAQQQQYIQQLGNPHGAGQSAGANSAAP